MNLLKSLAVAVLLGTVTAAHSGDVTGFHPEGSLLASPPGQHHTGDGHGDIDVAANGDIYVSVQGGDRPGMQVYNASGQYLHNLSGAGSDYHGFSVHRDSDGNEYLYVIEMDGGRLLKLTLDGTPVLTIDVAELVPKALQARRLLFKGVRLTDVAVASDGLIFVADGYASSRIHLFSPQGAYLRSIGSKQPPHNFSTAHKIVVDTRFDPERLLVTDRENDRLVWLDFNGEILAVKEGLRRPAALALRGQELAVGELEGRIVVLDRQGDILQEIGRNDSLEQIATPKVPPEEWKSSLVTAPSPSVLTDVTNCSVKSMNACCRSSRPPAGGCHWRACRADST